MSQSKLPKELQFRKGDIVKMVQLKSKKKWNGKLATIIGPFNKEKQRWPIEINFDDKQHALLQSKNLRIHKQGIEWIIDINSPIQRLNLLLKSYTRDLEAFSKLTRRQNKIFNDNFKYEMHDNIIINNLSQFDQQLNIIKSNIIKLSEENKNNKIEKFLMDDTKVMALNDDLTQFNIIVSIKIGDNKSWQRITKVDIDSKTKLISNAKIISIQVVQDKDDENDKQNDANDNNTDSKQDQESGNILNAIKG